MLDRGLGKMRLRGSACAVDEDVESTVRLLRDANHRADIGFDSHVGTNEGRAATPFFDLLDGLAAAVLVDVGDDDRRSGSSEAEGNRAPGPRAAPSRDERYAVQDLHGGDHGKWPAADNRRAVRRSASAIAFLAVLLAVLLAAGCGQRFEREAGDGPAPADLAADALAALEAQGSAHFVVDLKAGSANGEFQLQFAVHAEGDASRTALDVEGSVDFGGASFRGHILVDEHDFFVQFMNQWYGEDKGLVEAMEEAKKEHDGRVWDELATPDGLRRNFGELFEGEVSQGPTLDGVATWQFEGRLDPEGVADFARRHEAEPTDLEKDMIRQVADASRFVLVVGQEDRLPRRLEFSVELSPEQLKKMQATESSTFGGADNFKATLELSEFGRPVEISAPKDFEPLDALFEELFSGFE